MIGNRQADREDARRFEECLEEFLRQQVTGDRVRMIVEAAMGLAAARRRRGWIRRLWRIRSAREPRGC